MMLRRAQSVLVLLMLGAVVTACAAGVNASSATVAPAAETPAAKPSVGGASAEAYVQPLRNVDLAFKRGGRLAEVLVKEGDRVQAGQTLLRLEDADLQASVAQAEATLAKAQAELASTKTGSTPAQIAQAEAVVANAQAALDQTKVGPTKEQVAVAQARVNTLQAQLANSEGGTRPETLAADAANLAQAEAAVKVAQANYDKVATMPDVGATQQSLDLQDATQKLEAARANHEALVNGPTKGELDVLRAQLAEGQASLAQTMAGSTPQEIAQAEAKLAEAKASLENVKAGGTPEQIAASQAAVSEAQAALDQAKAALADAELKAPFSGTVGAMNLEVGQYVAPGTPVVSLADMTGWKVQTDNLTEAEVVNVAEGQQVKLSVDALPGETFEGTVSHIKPRSETKAGDVTYTVDITLNKPDPRLRWGMTTSVQFPAGQ